MSCDDRPYGPGQTDYEYDKWRQEQLDKEMEMSEPTPRTLIERLLDCAEHKNGPPLLLREAVAALERLQADGPIVDGGLELEVDADLRPISHEYKPRRIPMRQALKESEMHEKAADDEAERMRLCYADCVQRAERAEAALEEAQRDNKWLRAELAKLVQAALDDDALGERCDNCGAEVLPGSACPKCGGCKVAGKGRG